MRDCGDGLVLKMRKSCFTLEHGLAVLQDGLYFCCLPPGAKLPLPDDGSPLSAAAISEARRHSQSHPPAICQTCPHYVEGLWPDNPKLRFINFAQTMTCNFRCEYCGAFESGRSGKEFPEPQLLALLQDLCDSGAVDRGNCLFAFTAGEPALLGPKMERILSYGRKVGARFQFSSNCSIYSPAIARSLGEDQYSRLITSLDAGRRETFKKIKGVDKFDAVLSNIRTYLAASNPADRHGLLLKYIIFDSNCAIEEMSAFVQVAHELKVRGFYLDLDYRLLGQGRDLAIKPEYIRCAAYGQYLAENTGLVVLYVEGTMFKLGEHLFAKAVAEEMKARQPELSAFVQEHFSAFLPQGRPLDPAEFEKMPVAAGRLENINRAPAQANWERKASGILEVFGWLRPVGGDEVFARVFLAVDHCLYELEKVPRSDVAENENSLLCGFKGSVPDQAFSPDTRPRIDIIGQTRAGEYQRLMPA